MSQPLWTPKQTEIQDTDVPFGVLLWKRANGTFIQDSKGNYLSLQGRVGDRSREERMRLYVAHELGITDGGPIWRTGVRKISDSEYADQMESLQSGETADSVDAYLQLQGTR